MPFFAGDKRTTLKELVAKKQVFAPCVWDCLSTKCAMDAGFQAVLLSSSALATCCYGLPDFKFITVDEMADAVKKITNAYDIPVIVDAEDVYSSSPVVVYRNVRKLIDAGAMAISVDDAGTFGGWERIMYEREKNQTKDVFLYNNVKHEVIPREEFYAKIRAAVDAAKGSDCMIIGRSEAKLQYGYDEAFERLVKCAELGVDMTMCIGLDNLEDSKRMAKLLPGPKMYPDVMARAGKSDVELEDIEKLGFNLVTMHYLEKGATYGMMLMGKENFKNNNSVFSEHFDVTGYMDEWGDSSNYHKWLKMEADYLG